MVMITGILPSVKDFLAIPDDVAAFDNTLITLINSALFIHTQLVNIPRFTVTTGEENWTDISGIENYQGLQEEVCLRVKLSFDPPSSGFVTTANQERIKELDWREKIEGDYVVATGRS
jgi:hypothetical protein